MVAILNPKWSPKYKNPPIWFPIGFCSCELISVIVFGIPGNHVEKRAVNYVPQMKFGRCIVFAPFLIIIILLLLSKFVQPIPIFLAYLVPLEVDVVPIKFHKFLFGE
jgi:hypothetical protein